MTELNAKADKLFFSELLYYFLCYTLRAFFFWDAVIEKPAGLLPVEGPASQNGTTQLICKNISCDEDTGTIRHST